MPLQHFHPAVARWFSNTFTAPTAAQMDAWPAIAAGGHALIAAPTGSGKTLAAFLIAIDRLVRQAAAGTLEPGVQVVYVSPLKALSNDIRRNLEQPLAGCMAELARLGLPPIQIRSQVRTGDTPQSERAAMLKSPPHILVTTPESLYLLLTSESGRKMLATTRSVIVDEIHAVAATKRGSHLALTLERLVDVCGGSLQRVGLSATQKPIEEVAHFLAGADAPCAIVDSGHVRRRDLALVLPDAPLDAVMSAETWNTLYDRIALLTQEHRTTLIFANTRRMVERVTRHLSERIGAANVAAHHGSLAKEHRLDAEQRLKSGQLRALVATASLELGIDIGDVELVCQLGSPRSISTFLQRVGRANHAVTGVPKGRLFPLSRDELVECTALLAAVRAGELDRLHIPEAPLDVLSQQIVAEVAAGERGEDELFALVRRAWPYRDLARAAYDEILVLLADGIATRRGRQSAYLHRDAVNRRLRARRGARLTAITCGGAIPQNADYQVVLEPQGVMVGTLNEDFAVESLAGDVFQLGNTSYRILRVEAGKVRVEDAAGMAPTLPFWLGEAPARTDELSTAVSQLRDKVDQALTDMQPDTLRRCELMLQQQHALGGLAAQQLVAYLATAKAVLGHLPTRERLVIERFFDEGGGMQLVIHLPFGARVNRAFGLALRKRFCQTFNFELQAAATEDAIVLSLGETHSFALESVVKYLHSNTVREVLVQAVLDAPLFITRWRWNATISLAIKTSRGGKKTPPPLLRMASEDLVSILFPDQIACAENLSGPRQVPDHPLVRQTLHDCLHEAMDIDGLVGLLRRLESGEVQVLTRDLPQPSMLAREILTARPYAYLDDAPLEERRTQAVAARRWLDPQTAADFGHLDPQAIARLRGEAWPDPENADELHDALMLLGVLPEEEGRGHAAVPRPDWLPLFETLVSARRATRLRVGTRIFWVATESLPLAVAACPGALQEHPVTVPAHYAARLWERHDAIRELLRGRLQAMGPVTAAELDATLSLPAGHAEAALLALEGEGFVMRGQFTAAADGNAILEWCERRLLARINRYTLGSLRARIEPVASADFMRFLLDWQGVTRDPRGEGPQSLAMLIEQLEGYEVPAIAWERDVLPARMQAYEPAWLDTLCLSGRVVWARLEVPQGAVTGPVRTTPLALLSRASFPLWRTLSQRQRGAPELSSAAQLLASQLRARGASFFDDLLRGSGLLQSQAENALGELVAAGLASADSFGGLRALLLPLKTKRRLAARGRRIALAGLEEAGRWSLLRPAGDADVAAAPAAEAVEDPELVQQVAMRLLQRYGVVFRRLLTREAGWLPPWHVLLRSLRRLEAQGHVRGGRFVAGVSGEQYALPDAVTALRAVRQRRADGALVVLSAADPLNLLGIVTPGARLPALAGNRLALRDGVPIAVHAGGQLELFVELTPGETWAVRSALLRGVAPVGISHELQTGA
ncbi:MAG: DEAD/DEAH box helicase [Steroidobacteraceae bacterium]